ncbi:hypothetical protein DPMN_072812 [Dreissena polymorpha]|uniref:Uncharacterized protein n=1 Tax=Dreissena polymorpha TaxID=45954 RepID=A0A9D4BXY9_DREPO|nr:hypothetical protein DPMN_072812 [Dreissena polymorpha]
MDNSSLAQWIKVPFLLESSVSQAKIQSETVNKIQHESQKLVTNAQSSNNHPGNRNVNAVCYACGHMKTDRNRPVKGRKGRKCKRKDILKQAVNQDLSLLSVTTN